MSSRPGRRARRDALPSGFPGTHAMHPIRNLLLFSALLLHAAVVPAGGLRSPGVTPDQLNSRLSGETPPLVIDVRSPDEYSAGHIPGAISIPAPTVNRHLDRIEAGGGDTVLYCNDLHFTKFAEQVLTRKGVKGFYHLEGGLNGWREAGLELESSLPE